MREMMNEMAELDATCLRTIAAAMREVAAVDGAHPREQELIDELVAGIPEGDGQLHLERFESTLQREALVKSLVLVAYADGRVSDQERAIVARYAHAVGLDDVEISRVWTDVASSLLSHFSRVQIYRDHVLDIGRRLGLGEEAIRRALS